MTRSRAFAVLVSFALSTTALSEPLMVSRTAAYAKPEDAAAEIQCTLAEFQAEAVRETLFVFGIAATGSGSDEIPAHGKFLSLSIDSARVVGSNFSAGVTTTARLFENGVEVAHFTQTRNSVRGIPGAGSRSSCRMKASCARTLAADIGTWLKGVLDQSGSREAEGVAPLAAPPPTAPSSEGAAGRALRASALTPLAFGSLRAAMPRLPRAHG